MSNVTGNLLSALVFLPVAAAVLIALLPRESVRLHKTVGLVASTGIFVLAMIPITWIMGKATLQLLGWI